MSRVIMTRGEARKRGLLYYFDGTPCRKGHRRGRRVSTNECLTCDRHNQQKYRDKKLKEQAVNALSSARGKSAVIAARQVLKTVKPKAKPPKKGVKVRAITLHLD